MAVMSLLKKRRKTKEKGNILSIYEKINSFISFFKDLAITLSIIVGSFWAVKTFIYQNPSFYDTGFETIGMDEDKISGEITLQLLDKMTSSYKVNLTLKNNSQTHRQRLFSHSLSIKTIHLSDNNGTKINQNLETLPVVEYYGDLITNSPLFIPTNESREYIGLIKFEEEGTYLLETNPCKAAKSNCSIQQYIFVRK